MEVHQALGELAVRMGVLLQVCLNEMMTRTNRKSHPIMTRNHEMVSTSRSIPEWVPTRYDSYIISYKPIEAVLWQGWFRFEYKSAKPSHTKWEEENMCLIRMLS